MIIYEKVARRLKNTGLDIGNVIKKDTLRKIRKDIETFKNENIIFGIEPLSDSNLMDFYKNIYLLVIGSKDNAKINNILEKLTPVEIAKKNRFFIFIKKWNILLWWWIFKYEDNILKFSYKANLTEEIDLKAWFGTIIDFLFFSFWIEKSVDYFSYGVDRNWYWALWSSHWVCFHKLLLWFKPYTIEANNMIEIDEKIINIPTIIFDTPNCDWEFQNVALIHFEDNNTDIFTKKWFSILFI